MNTNKIIYKETFFNLSHENSLFKASLLKLIRYNSCIELLVVIFVSKISFFSLKASNLSKSLSLFLYSSFYLLYNLLGNIVIFRLIIIKIIAFIYQDHKFVYDFKV